MRWFGALLAVALVAGCGGPSATTETTTTPVANGTQPSGITGFRIDNRSTQTICFAYVSLSSQGSWGDDRLGASETIASGASRDWEIDPGTWDVKLENCEHQALLDQRGLNVAAGQLNVLTVQ